MIPLSKLLFDRELRKSLTHSEYFHSFPRIEPSSLTMSSIPTLTVLEECQVSPPPATVGDRSLPLTFFDILSLTNNPVHTVYFYEFPAITQTQFTNSIIPNLKHSLSITLQHFFPFVGKLILFPSTPTKTPEIRYLEGDSIAVTVAECNLDFNDLTGNHPRNCDKFYHLIPLLGRTTKVSDYLTIPVFAVQMTLFPNSGISIGVTNHHSLCDATTRFYFLKAWTSIAQSGSDELFRRNGSLPVYDRLVVNPKLDEIYLKNAKIETFNENFQLSRLHGPSDKVRGTFILKQSFIDRLKNSVLTQMPKFTYVSSFTVACGYIWSCIAKSRNNDLQLFGVPINCRARIDPPVPDAYFGNCLMVFMVIAKRVVLIGEEGFVTAARLIGENLHKLLTDKEGMFKEVRQSKDLFPDGMLPTMIWVTGTTKLEFYGLDFGFGKPKQIETLSNDYNGGISVNTCKESNKDLEIGVSLLASEMEVFVRVFNEGLETYI